MTGVRTVPPAAASAALQRSVETASRIATGQCKKRREQRRPRRREPSRGQTRHVGDETRPAKPPAACRLMSSHESESILPFHRHPGQADTWIGPHAPSTTSAAKAEGVHCYASRANTDHGHDDPDTRRTLAIPQG